MTNYTTLLTATNFTSSASVPLADPLTDIDSSGDSRLGYTVSGTSGTSYYLTYAFFENQSDVAQ